MIIDSFIFNGELDMLEFRLKILWDHVDKFVIVESDHTFSGKPKPYHFIDNHTRFDWAGDKIIYWQKSVTPDENPWINEARQRDEILNACREFSGDDLLIMSDVDEIPTWQAIKDEIATGCLTCVCVQHFFYYNLRTLLKELWLGTIFCTLEVARGKGIPAMRNRRKVWIPLDNSGWHLSYFGDPGYIRDKIESFSHQEYNTPEFTDVRHIRECIDSGLDLFKRGTQSLCPLPAFFPSYFVEIAKSYNWGLKSDSSKANERRPLKVLVFSRELHQSSCARLRVIAPLAAMRGEVDMTWVEPGTSINIDAIAQTDLIVIQGGFPEEGTARVLDLIFASGKPVAYDLDELLTDLPADNPHIAEYERCRKYICDSIRRATAVIVPSYALAGAFGEYNRNIVVLPTLIEDTLWNFPTRDRKSPVVIGYAGTPIDNADLESIAEALEKISVKYGPRVSFRFPGYATERLCALPGSSLLRFGATYESYAQTLQRAAIDIGLAPLTDNPFNRCKSNIKWLEYSACGIAGIYANLPPYASCIDHGKTGLLVSSNPETWVDAISKLIDGPDYRATIARQARETVLSHYSVSKNAHRFLDTYRRIADIGGTREML